MVILEEEMGRHKEWRKIAKRERRRKIRTLLARNRESEKGLLSADYQSWSEKEDILEIFEMEQIELVNKEENEKWLRAENVAAEQWRILQEKKEKLYQQQLDHEAKQKLEWELEKQRHAKEQERLKEIEEENKHKQQLFMQKLEQFLLGNLDEPPAELLVSHETKPNAEPCPFFIKTACCRFGDQCSRNHKFPGISKILLATNFYSHFGLDNATVNEYDTDVMLEYEDTDTYKEFREFFYDVIREFEKFGKIVQFKVCNNYEKHLRGNVYIEFAELRCAVAAYRSLHTRWYGGKQLSLQFCFISNWKNAICGLQSRKRCPKGRACNFLHVFRNPNNLFGSYFAETDVKRSERSLSRSWRWSESPEVEIEVRSESKNSKRREDRERRAEAYRSYKRDSHRRTRRRRSSERRKR